MNVLPIMVDVNINVRTLLVVTHVLVILDIVWLVMGNHVMVRLNEIFLFSNDCKLLEAKFSIVNLLWNPIQILMSVVLTVVDVLVLVTILLEAITVLAALGIHSIVINMVVLVRYYMTKNNCILVDILLLRHNTCNMFT